jgi:hypothetical protein
MRTDSSNDYLMAITQSWTNAWNDEHGLRSRYTRLIELRKRHPSLRSYDLQWLELTTSEHILAYVRSAVGERPIVVMLNFGSEQADIRLPDDVCHALDNAELTDLLEETPLVTREDGRVLLPPYGVRILSRPLRSRFERWRYREVSQ